MPFEGTFFKNLTMARALNSYRSEDGCFEKIDSSCFKQISLGYKVNTFDICYPPRSEVISVYVQ